MAGWGIVMVIIACVLQDVVSALTIAYDILVGGLLVPILGGLIGDVVRMSARWQRWRSEPW